MSTVNTLDQLRRRIGSGSAPVAFAALAEEHRRAGRLDEAVAVCRDGLERYPAYVSARVTLGRALLDLGSVREAVLELEAAVEQSPDNLAAARVLTDARNRLVDMPPAHVEETTELEETTEPLGDEEARGGGHDVTDYGGMTAAFQEVDPGETEDHAGVWLMPVADETGTTPVVGEWHEPSDEPTVVGDITASSWDDETIYAPVALAPASSAGRDPRFEDAGAPVESLAVEGVDAAADGLAADSPRGSAGEQWELVETAKEPASADAAHIRPSCEESNAAPPAPDGYAWGDVEAGVEERGGESSDSVWFAHEVTLDTALDAASAEPPPEADVGIPSVAVAPEAENGDIAEVTSPGVRDLPAVGLQTTMGATSDDVDEVDVPSVQPQPEPQVHIPTEAPSEGPSTWACLLEAAVDEVFADAATPHVRALNPPTCRDHTAPTAPAAERDDATVLTLQTLLAAVRARRAELGLSR